MLPVRGGLNHERLTYGYAGREVRLIGVMGNVVQGILARGNRLRC
jgi:hypothetical protein